MSTVNAQSALIRPAVLVGCLLLAACGGSADKTQPASTVMPTRDLHGGVVKAPVSGAQVDFFSVDVNGDPVPPAVATATTDADGAFNVPDLPAGIHLARSRGGSFADESDPNGQRRITLGPDQGFETVIPEDATTATLNPFTQALVNKVRAQAVRDGVPFASLVNSARGLFAQAFGFDILTTIPANPVAPAASASPAARAYAMVLGGLANAANRIATEQNQPAPSFLQIAQLSQSVSQGQGGQLLNREIERFRNNNDPNYSGVAPVVLNLELLNQDLSGGPVVNLTGDVSALEASGQLVFTVTVSPASPAAVQFQATVTGQTADAGSDFTDPSGFFSIPAGETAFQVVVPVTDDSEAEPDETLQLSLSNVLGAALGSSNSAVGTIQNDDEAAEPTPAPTPVPTPEPTPPPATNNPPVASNDTATVAEDSGLAPINVLANDSDPDGDSLTITSVGTPSNGGFVRIISNTVEYEPAPNFSGTESFSYFISDGQGGTDSAIVTVTVTAVNDPPVPVGSLLKTVSVNDAPPPPFTTGELSASDADNPPLNSLVFSVLAQTSCGQFTLSGSPTTSFTQQDLASSLVRFDPFDCIGGDSVTASMSLSDGIAAPVSFSFSVNVTASCAIPPDGLVAWFSGDAVHSDGTNLLAYDIEQGNHGSWLVGADSGVVTGQVAEAMSFGATDDLIQVPGSASYVMDAFTIDAWVFLNALPGTGLTAPILQASGGFSYDFELVVTESGELAGFASGGDGSASATSPGGSIPTGQWVHVAMSYVDSSSSGGMQLYIDGAPVFPTPLMPQASFFGSPSTVSLSIGGDSARTTGQPSFNGLIDELQLIKRVMSDGEIQAIYRAGSVGKCKPLPTSDSDGDGLAFSGEMQAGSNPRNPDTDGDGLSDGDEVNNPTFPSDPTLVDTDGDDLPDGDEIAAGTDPADPADPGPGGKIYVSSSGADTNDGSSWATAELTTAGILANPAYATLADTSPLFIIIEEFHTIDGMLLDAGTSSRSPISIIGSQSSGTPMRKATSGNVNSHINAGLSANQTDPTDCGSSQFNDAALIVQGIPNVSVSRVLLENGRNACRSGGGVSILDSNVTLDQVIVSNNKATLTGGSVNSNGGGVAVRSISVAPLNLTITNSEIKNNDVVDGSGGGIYIGPDITLRVDNTRIYANTVGRGGGGISASCPGTPSSCNMQLTNSEIIGNAADSSGGGVVVQGMNVLEISDTLIANNRMATAGMGGQGGGIDLGGEIINGRIRHNRVLGNGLNYTLNTSTGQLDKVGTASGGGIRVSQIGVDGAGNKIDISNNLVSGNAGEIGGGIQIIGANSSPLDSFIVAHNTIVLNRGEVAAGGISFSNNLTATTLDVANNIIRYNENADPATHGESDDNYSDPDSVANRVLNNVEVTTAGTDFDSDPMFVQDFFLDQGMSGPGQSVGGGDPSYNGLLSLGIDARTTDANGAADTGADDLGYHHDRAGSGVPDTSLVFRSPCGDFLGSAGAGGTVPLTPQCFDVTEFRVEPSFGGQPEAGHRVAAYVTTFDLGAGALACTGGMPEPSCPEVLTGPFVFAVDSDPNGRLLRDNGDGSYSLRLKWRNNAGDAVLRFLVDGQSFDTTVSAAYTYACYGSYYTYRAQPYSYHPDDLLPSSSPCTYYGSGY